MSLRITSLCLAVATAAILADGSHVAHRGAAELVPMARAATPGARPATGEDRGGSAALVESLWADLAEGNRRFVDGDSLASEVVLTRQRLAGGQHPQVIVLGCADSRVSPELVFNQGLGELFVVRTAGNIADPVALGSIEYAAEHLHSPLLVILGHEKCGAVAAAASGAAMPSENLQAIVSRITPAFDLLPRSLTTEQLATVGVEANIQRSAKDVLAASPILRHEVAAGRLTVIKAVYRLETGEVTRL